MAESERSQAKLADLRWLVQVKDAEEGCVFVQHDIPDAGRLSTTVDRRLM